eukprot:6049464-Prorocentrum_lima.AAC.1
MPAPTAPLHYATGDMATISLQVLTDNFIILKAMAGAACASIGAAFRSRLHYLGLLWLLPMVCRCWKWW